MEMFERVSIGLADMEAKLSRPKIEIFSQIELCRIDICCVEQNV